MKNLSWMQQFVKQSSKYTLQYLQNCIKNTSLKSEFVRTRQPSISGYIEMSVQNLMRRHVQTQHSTVDEEGTIILCKANIPIVDINTDEQCVWFYDVQEEQLVSCKEEGVSSFM